MVEKRSGSLSENLQKPFFLQDDSETCNSHSQRCQYQVLLNITLLSFRSVFAHSSMATAASSGDGDVANESDPIRQSYCVRALIGEGQYGRVYRAYHRTSLAARALKVITRDSGEAEKNLLMSLPLHPSIIPLIEYFPPDRSCGRTDGVLVFPERESDLAHFMSRRRGDGVKAGLCDTAGPGLCNTAGPCLSRGVIAMWAKQLLSGLSHLHDNAYLHRDLKPGNILLKWNDHGTLDVEIADFGTARFVDVSAGRRFRKKTKVDMHGVSLREQFAGLTPHCCTVPYAAPEIWFGGWENSSDFGYGYAVDIWSYGTIVFELLTLQMFSIGNSDAERVASVLRRIGPCPDKTQLGPRQVACFKAAKNWDASEIKALREYGDVAVGTPFGHVSKSLVWAPELRLEAKRLLEDEWLNSPIAASQGLAPMPTGQKPKQPDAKEKTAVAENASTESALPSSTKRKRDPKVCLCSGHCNTPGHRYKNGCSSEIVPAGSQYCADCECVMPTCVRPKNKSDFCHGHRSVFLKLPWPLQATRAARAVLPRILPCDIKAFKSVCASLLCDLPALIIANVLKEPRAVLRFAEEWDLRHKNGSAKDVFPCLLESVRCVNGAPHKQELKQISRQGVARWLGVSVFCRAVNVIQSAEDAVSASARDGREILVLGIQAQEFTLASQCPAELLRFIDACQHWEKTALKLWDLPLHAFAPKIREMLQDISAKAKLNWNSYVIDYLIRKFVICVLVHQEELGEQMDCSVSWLSFESLAPDMTNQLQAAFPRDFSAADASHMITGRPDQALFLSMWACLFKEVEARYADDLSEVLKLLQHPLCENVIETFLQANDSVAPCPVVLVDRLFKAAGLKTPPASKSR